MLKSVNPRIALVITDQETNAQIQRWGVDCLELRADLFHGSARLAGSPLDPAYVASQVELRRKLKIPLLLTVRNQKKEGAVRIFDDRLKWSIMREALPLVDMVDIELSSPLLGRVKALARKHGKKVIVSAHHFDHTPVLMEPILKKALSTRADMVKIAAKANTWDDVLRMIEFTHRHRKHRLITISLGPLGVISRVILPAAGSMFTYAFLHKPTAPGQISVAALKAHLKFFYP